MMPVRSCGAAQPALPAAGSRELRWRGPQLTSHHVGRTTGSFDASLLGTASRKRRSVRPLPSGCRDVSPMREQSA
jgi:hypothetical protein